MAVICANLKLIYFTTPKVASTTVRRMLREGERVKGGHKGPLPLIANERLRFFHRKLARENLKVAVVRDPIKRFVSGYRNRLAFYKSLSEGSGVALRARLLGISTEPDFEEFVTRFYRYMALHKTVRYHFHSARWFLGGDLGYYDRLFPIEQLDQLAELISERAGQTIALRHLRTEGHELPPTEISPVAMQHLRRLTAGDYALLKDYYVPPE